MFTATPIEYTLAILTKNLEKAKDEIRVYEQGLLEEERELELMHLYQEALCEAVYFLRHANVTVSLREFKNIRIEAENGRKGIAHKRGIIHNIKSIIRGRKKDVEIIQQNIDTIATQSRRGVVLEFKRK